jgi:stearoyl-CoA desaturase (delta-9 desaturase)
VSPANVKKYAPDIISTDDWMDRNVYGKYTKSGLLIFWALFTIFFGVTGFLLGFLHFLFCKHLLIIVTVYSLHKVGFTYAGNNAEDKSKIISPIGIFLGGEELHANHHNDDSVPWFSRHWWEFDVGWFYCRIFLALRLMELNDRKKWM